ncbi:MAG: hypothetical protein COT85_01670 [Chlamydiae bacterium CG10_big_fil_rev_8_21_14_0_10_42_34]|nr:MAG: hypothetical protein COT85_01670 [Chlamydiae bacterium CG10_big_fil_rev_8_21_14_0_10_42_34]
MKQKLKDTISVQDAMDNLAAIASFDINDPSPLGIIKKNRIITSDEEVGSEGVLWLSGEGVLPLYDILDLTYRSIHQHLLKLYDSPDMNWENEKSSKGIAAMMTLVGESGPKMDKFLKEHLGKKGFESVSEGQSFQDLQQFYSNKFAKRFADGVEGKGAWSEEWEENEESSLLDLSKTGLKDFDTVRNDSEYELFYIRNEDGEPYFNAELLRNIKLDCDFDLDGESFEEDPLLKIRAMQDRDLHASAAQILSECHAAISDFYKIARKLEGNELSHSLGMAIIALFVAANPRYLLQNTMGKSCLQYFEDFHHFLRRAMRTSEYQKLIAYPPDKTDKTAHLLMYLTHALCRSFFERAGGVKLETIGLIHRTMRRGEEIKQKGNKRLVKGESIWNQFMLDDEKFRTLLAKFPNGPLFKILDLIREEQEEDINIPFDPIGQNNLPSRIFQIEKVGKKIDVLHLPSPIRQAQIHKAEFVDEFQGFLRSLTQDSPVRKHLIINLQDRSSWKEYARSKAIENLQFNAEFNHQLLVITLPKYSDFYYQNNEYLSLNKADDFIKAFEKQLKTPEESGYFLPPELKKGELEQFIDKVLPAIHKHFFHQKNSLTRRNREDFIEIFYQFFVLKCIDMLEPHSVSFTCKDAIDIGAAQQGAFFGFIQLLTGDFSEKENQDFLRWLLYTPALFVRERAIDPERLNRTISALERIDGEMKESGKEILKVFGDLYQGQTFKTIQVKHL